MKKIITLSLIAAGAVFSASGATPAMKKGVQLKQVYESADVKSRAGSDLDLSVYYPAPAGVFYLGLPLDGDHYDVPEAAIAPNGVDVTFSTDVDLDDYDYVWYYVDAKGNEYEAENEDCVMNIADVTLVEAPTLRQFGYTMPSGKTYTMAREGLIFGQGYYGDFYPSNQNVAILQSSIYDPAALSVNYSEAGKNLADKYPVKITDVTVKGFGELFRYGGKPYAFDALRCQVIYASGNKAAENQIEADIYPIGEDGKVDFSNLLATYVNTKIAYQESYDGAYWYGIEFGPKENAEAPVIKSDVMVIFRPTEGTTDYISPDMGGTMDLPEMEPTTSYVYASYTRNGETFENGCLPYVGELESHYTYYSKHWLVSGKINYDVKEESGIGQIEADNVNADAIYFNLQGQRVVNPAKGLYIRRQGTSVTKVIL